MNLLDLLSARGYEYVLEPSPVPLPLDRPQETRVLQVSCGRAHSLILTDREGGELACCRFTEEWGNHFLALGLKLVCLVEPHVISEAPGTSRAPGHHIGQILPALLCSLLCVIPRKPQVFRKVPVHSRPP